ncbi:helix-turn-helix transcriptional regulator [Aminobacter anthyllidis]|uniref:helix-turn-helix domain-containing protein n=1 Tax=Aminobacter anthyllidis TaxID=1035067 RepID=UPI00313B2C52
MAVLLDGTFAQGAGCPEQYVVAAGGIIAGELYVRHLRSMHIRQIRAMNIRSVFGLNLQRRRRERRLSQEQLARLAGCARAYLSGAEAGRRNATLDMVEALATVLEVEPADLLKDPAAGRETR